MNNFILKTPFAMVHTRSFELVIPELLDPTYSGTGGPLVMGEFLQIDDASYKMERGTGDAECPSFAFFQAQGAYDIQALGKAPFLFVGPYEAETLVMLDTSIVVGSPLMVTDITFDGVANRRGLALATATHYVVGYCTRTPAENNGYLRFIRA
jgi:hypothetical protein